MEKIRKPVKIIHKIINTVLLIIIVLVFIFAVYVVWDNGKIVNDAASVSFIQYKPEDSAHYTFDELKKINPEVFGWITIDDTGVDYPVCRGNDNSKYINTDAKGKFSLSGSLFLDFRNDISLNDFCSVIYGHHMARDAMFGSFDDYADSLYFESHKEGNIFFDEQNHKITIFAFLRVNGYDTEIYNTNVKITESSAFVEKILEKAEVVSEDSLTIAKEAKRVLLLSTCAAEDTDGRLVLAAAVDDGRNIPAVYVHTNKKTFPVWIIVVIVFILLIIIFLSLYLHKNKKKPFTDKNE